MGAGVVGTTSSEGNGSSDDSSAFALLAPLRYGTCGSLEVARKTAETGQRDGLLGMYPAASVVLDKHVARLENVLRGLVWTWDNGSDGCFDNCIEELRVVVGTLHTGG